MDLCGFVSWTIAELGMILNDVELYQDQLKNQNPSRQGGSISPMIKTNIIYYTQKIELELTC